MSLSTPVFSTETVRLTTRAVSMLLKDPEVGYRKAVMELSQFADLLRNGRRSRRRFPRDSCKAEERHAAHVPSGRDQSRGKNRCGHTLRIHLMIEITRILRQRLKKPPSPQMER